MKPLHELAASLSALAHAGWTPPDCNVPDLARQVRELEAQQAQVAEELRAAEDALPLCVPDGSNATLVQCLRLQRRATSARLQFASLNTAEVYLRSELERQAWQAQHRQATREACAVAA
ncbi:hypothetical protein G4177_06300 [Corallococcus sp. ZKHCc1 1396]|uniref:Uncharacterized protein n=1 Tax=Corallococcus soli TaxID=2710757 RepID=A0ABR9PIW2_9BACT|nr:hypothetical protein [Corallococcus soli]MBE4747789.1 hypothetical protein [Corallococcus soli]